ncbi:MAG TPA: RNA-binding domain-containing protein [Methanobacteriaceae archaeon]|nr:RNA-binding domain-containing protein [Methanobacteriaceae archaeon]
MIHNITYRTLVYGTEDEKRVRIALSNILPFSEPDTKLIEGHHKNQMVILTGKTDKKSDIEVFLQSLENIKTSDKKRILRGLENKIDDKGNLFLRFDKQRAYRGEMKIVEDGDAVHLKLKLAAYPARKDPALKIAQKIFGEEDVH